MATWEQFSAEAPELAAAARRAFVAAKHHVLATLRRDGSPRVSGTEVDFRGPDLALGSMGGARKAADLRRDGRFALHANPTDDLGSGDKADAKVAGYAVEVPPGEGDPEGSHLFLLDLREAVVTSVHPDGDRIVIESWRPGEGVKRVERT
jgi:hypothetical protein